MKIRRLRLTSTLGAALLLAMGPLPAPIYMNVPAGETLKTSVRLQEAALCDGSVRLEAGLYAVTIKSLGDGSVHATFTGNGRTGQATGKTQGHEGVVVQGGLQPGAANAVVVEGGRQPGAVNSVVVEGGKQPSVVPSFASLGFTPQSQTSSQKLGNHLNVIVKGQGSNQILIGLLLPAINKGNVQIQGVEKAREAAVSPAK